MAQATLSTHVLDTTSGTPAAGVDVALYRDGALAAKGTTGKDGRVAILNAHPRIGADAASLSTRSRREQGEAADGATSQELDELNDAYEDKFGFRFVVFVAGRSKKEIVPILRARLAHNRDAELKAGIDRYLPI